MLHSAFWLAATAPSAGDLSRTLEAARGHLGLVVLLFVATLALSVTAAWAASFATVTHREKCTWWNALKVNLLYILTSVMSVGIAIAAFRLTESNGASSFATAVFGVTMAFAIPMKTYEMIFVRALFWIVLSAVYSFIGSIVLSFALAGAIKPLTDQLDSRSDEAPRTKSSEAAANSQRTPTSRPAAPTEARPTSAPAAPRAVDEARFAANEKVAADQARAQPERMAALGELYRLLEQERVALPPGDAAARAAFDQRRARYEAILQRMRAEPTPKPKK